ncbi:hypothetical protein D3C83_327650 [compost metagenome]
MRVEPIFFDRIFHSSIWRAASIRRLVFDFSIVSPSVSVPGEKAKSPWAQRASS